MKWIRKHKTHLRMRIFLMFSLLLMAALAITSAVDIVLTQALIRRDYISSSERDIALVSSMLQSKLTHLSDYAISIASDSRVIAAARQFPNGPVTVEDQVALRRALGGSVGTIIGANTDLYMYDICSLSGNAFGINGNDLSRILSDLDAGFFEEAMQSLGIRITGPYRLRFGSGYNVPAFIITKAIVNLDNREPYGILMLVVRETVFSREYSNSGSDIAYYIVNGDMDIVSAANDNHLSQNAREICGFSEDDFQTLSAGGHLTLWNGGEETLLICSKPLSRRADWRVLAEVSLRGMRNTRRQAIGMILAVAAIALLALLLISFQLAHTICEPINGLSRFISQAAERGEMQRVPNPKSSYEIDILYEGFNNLADQIQALIRHINQEQEEKSNYQFQLIQAQIKPHFLYNTLMTIKSLIDLGMEETAGECIYAMSSFYRLSLNRGNDILTVRDEIELSQQYMVIQKLRYIDRLDYVFDIPPSLHGCMIPKMTIQPLLENAIYHGIKEKAGRGVIEVVGKDLGDAMRFSIHDNGNGIDPQTLAKLWDSLSGDAEEIAPHNPSFGLYSVNRRIHLLYGSRYGLSVDSCPGEYTTVTLNLPKSFNAGGDPS